MNAVESRAGAVWRSAIAYLSESVDGAGLATFRILFGGLMAIQAFFHYLPLATSVYSPERFHFTYPFFGWVVPWPGVFMQVHMVIMGVAALGVMLGLFYRVSSIVYFLTYSYVFLIEKSTFNNHYYLIVLFAFLLSVTNAHACWAIDNFRGQPGTGGLVGFWSIFLLRAQVVCVYFYGGLAKLNADWLQGEPIRKWLADSAAVPLLGPIISQEWCVYVFAYGGLVFDIAIGFLLCWRRTRLIALAPLLLFHFTNGWIFKIGVFPWLALAATIVFFAPDMPRYWLRKLGFPITAAASVSPATNPVWRQSVVTVFVILYLMLQVILPLRHFVTPGNPQWTEAGHMFAWHMKLSHKQAKYQFVVSNPATGETREITRDEQLQDLMPKQRLRMLTSPSMIVQYAHYLHDKYQSDLVPDPVVQANILVSLNGRPFRPLIDSRVNLAQETYKVFGSNDWILPLEPGLPVGNYEN